MRLIDADKVLEFMRNKWDMQDMYLPIHFKELVIDEIPTTYDIDKVVEELEEAKYMIALDYDDSFLYKSAINDAIEIVKAGVKNEV